MATLAQQLLTFAGRLRFQRETLDLNAVVTEFEPLVREALVDLELSLAKASVRRRSIAASSRRRSSTSPSTRGRR